LILLAETHLAFFLGGRMVTTGGTNGLDPLLVTAFQQLLLQPLKKDWISTRPGSEKRTGFVSRSFKITQKKPSFLGAVSMQKYQGL